MPALGWFALPGSPIPATAAENFFLGLFHFPRAGLRSIVESIQM
jgi:hypothetical protein